jgi:putative transposase
VLGRYPDFAELIAARDDEALSRRLRQAETIGRPLGADAFIASLETESGRTPRPGKRGPRRRGATGDK